MSKKSLDDYVRQIKEGLKKEPKFDFVKYKSMGMGELRKFNDPAKERK